MQRRLYHLQHASHLIIMRFMSFSLNFAIFRLYTNNFSYVLGMALSLEDL